VKYTIPVAYLNTPLLRFFVASLTIHVILLLLWQQPVNRTISPETIAVSLLPPQPEESQTKPSPAPRATPRRPSKAPVQVAKKNAPLLREKPVREKTARDKTASPLESPEEKEPAHQEARPRLREPIPDRAIFAERPLPTLKELLPQVGWSADARTRGADGPVRLDTKDPQYVTYFNSIKRAIEVVWQYPELALRYGLQGRLLLEFSILGNGDLESAKIVRSSGSNLLDEEALRAVKAAAPFGAIPPWIGRNRIDIVASFEYLDNRLNYRYMR
jgi:protein TonB